MSLIQRHLQRRVINTIQPPPPLPPPPYARPSVIVPVECLYLFFLN